jgi:hypothetical protein
MKVTSLDDANDMNLSQINLTLIYNRFIMLSFATDLT